MTQDTTAAASAAVRVARESYGRIVAWLAWQWRDIASAEDALAEAFARALARWPLEGVPASPEGWLMTVAKRQLLMGARRQRHAADPAFAALLRGTDEAHEAMDSVPDVRLRLMLVCAHPAIDATVQSALMLQVVLGLSVERIAPAYLLGTEALAKRLVRAKAKIRDTRIRFEEPETSDLAPRVASVLEAIYAAYTLAWNHEPTAPDAGATDLRAPACGDAELAEEAVYLADLVASQLPELAEAQGLVALLWLNEARAQARLAPGGSFVPLDRQDPDAWNATLIEHASARLLRAASLGAPGRFQLEAAIQAAHLSRRASGTTPWHDIVALYDRLLAIAPTVGARIGRAVALARATKDARAGLRDIDAIDSAQREAHQPWWVARAHLLLECGRTAAAAEAFAAALALTRPRALRDYLSAELQRARALTA